MRPIITAKTMIGNDMFCPETGAPLSDEKHYDDQGRSYRVTYSDEFTPESYLSGEFTTGSVESSKSALFNQFRRCHQRHCDSHPKLYRKAALALSRLKGAAAGQQGHDIYVWYALQRRLQSQGFEVKWMHTHVEPRCPDCHGELTYEIRDNGTVIAECGTHCIDYPTNKLPTIRETIAGLYTQAFDDPIDSGDFLHFGYS